MSRHGFRTFLKVALVLVAAFGLAAGLSRRSEVLRVITNNREALPASSLQQPPPDRGPHSFQPAGSFAGQTSMVSLQLVDTLQTNVMTAETNRVIVPAVDTAAKLSFKNGPDAGALLSLGRANSLLNMFRLTRGPLVGTRTLVENSKSVFVAEWEGSSTSPAIRRMIAWATPDFDLLMAEVDSETLSPDRLKEFFAATIVTADSGLDKPKVWFWMNKDPGQPGLQGVGRVAYNNGPSSATLKGYEFELAVISTGSKAYVAFKIGKLVPVDKPTTEHSDD